MINLFWKKSDIFRLFTGAVLTAMLTSCVIPQNQISGGAENYSHAQNNNPSNEIIREKGYRAEKLKDLNGHTEYMDEIIRKNDNGYRAKKMRDLGLRRN